MTLASLLLRLVLCIALLSDASSAHASVSAHAMHAAPIGMAAAESTGVHSRAVDIAPAAADSAFLPCHAEAGESVAAGPSAQPASNSDTAHGTDDRACCGATGGCECVTPLAMPVAAPAAVCALPAAGPCTAGPASRTPPVPAFPIRPPIRTA